MIETYKFRLYPNEEQIVLLEKHFGCCRFVYNWYLDYNQKQYTTDHKYVGWMSLSKTGDFIQLKKDNEWLSEVNSQSLLWSISNCDKAFQRFFKHTSKYPKFKSKCNDVQSFGVPQNLAFDFRHSKVFIPKFKKDGIKCVFSRKIKPGRLGTATVSRNARGQYFISIMVHTDGVEPKLRDRELIREENCLGLDFGLKHFLTCSDGRVFDSPEFFKQSLEKLAWEQRKLSRKQKGSRKREKQRIKVAKTHNRIANQRNDYLNKLSASLVNESQVDCICIEDLDLKGMSKLWGRKVGDLSYHTFTTMLNYKLTRKGKRLLKIGRFEPSSQICSHCGHRRKIGLKERTYICPDCGLEIDRDLNAAINIRNFAMRKLISNTVGTTEINACGDGAAGFGEASSSRLSSVSETGKVPGTSTRKPITL